MEKIIYIDRQTGKLTIEKVFGEKAIKIIYGKSFASQLIRPVILPLLSKFPFFSALYGFINKQRFSAKKIEPFIKEFDIDSEEFLDPITTFQSFNDFFTRRLKPEARPIASGGDIAIIPADARYYFYQHLDQVDGFVVKGQKFNLENLFECPKLASQYHDGSMVIARLCPSDYHRYHLPCDCVPSTTRLINGWLYSVNPVAIKRDIEIFTKNKRTICELVTENFGKVIYVEIGATNVGSIHQTYSPDIWQAKGAEKGYFSFGASSLILLFPKDSIIFDADLIDATQNGYEIRCLMGQSMGRAVKEKIKE